MFAGISSLDANVDFTVNEYYLMHGTSARRVKGICDQGFDNRVGSADGLFGQGIYFAERSTKSDGYTGESPTHKQTLQEIWILNVNTH